MIAFLFPAFPVLHQTFVLWEVLALRKAGIDIALYSIKQPSTAMQQPEGEALRSEVCYLPSPLSWAVLRANLAMLVRAPATYLGVYGRLCREWWRDRHAGKEWTNRSVSEQAPDRRRTLRERLEGAYNRNAFLYLVKSLLLVPQAAYLGLDLERRGITRLHAHWASYPATMALVVHWLFGIRFSFTAHAYDIYVVPRLLGVKVRDAHFAVTCGRVNATYLNALAGTGEDRVLVNYHGVDLQRFPPRATAPVNDVPVILTCGRLEPYKGHHVLLEACAMLSRPVRCVLVGEGPQRIRLEQQAVELGIVERVELSGPLPQRELVKRYAQADLFVLASVIIERSGKRDVIPNVLAEAMAMEVPVVATDVSGVSELVTDGESGRLVPGNDARALARVIDELLADPEQRRRLAAGGRAKVAALFDRDRNIQDLIPLFRE